MFVKYLAVRRPKSEGFCTQSTRVLPWCERQPNCTAGIAALVSLMESWNKK
jgi:hypothetical protein